MANNWILNELPNVLKLMGLILLSMLNPFKLKKNHFEHGNLEFSFENGVYFENGQTSNEYDTIRCVFLLSNDQIDLNLKQFRYRL